MHHRLKWHTCQIMVTVSVVEICHEHRDAIRFYLSSDQMVSEHCLSSLDGAATDSKRWNNSLKYRSTG